MKMKVPFFVLLLICSFHSYTARAEGERDEGNNRNRRSNPAPRPAPPKFMAHPPGQHPHGPMVRAHSTRVLQPRVLPYGGRVWNHWEHPEFARPAYYWDWGVIHNVSCVTEDSYGDQYPITEATFQGFGLVNMTAIEDDALDRCYSESGGDNSCYLVSCVHF